MKFTSASPWPVLLILLAGCTGLKISSESDSSYDFSRIETYQWVDAPSPVLEQADTYLFVELQQCLNSEMAARGWKQVLETKDATVQVDYYVTVIEHQEFAGAGPDDDLSFSGGLVYDRGSGKWAYEQRLPDDTAYAVAAGTLHLRMLDPRTGRAVWEGTAETVLNRSSREEDRDELFHRIARRLVEQIPGGPLP